MSFELKDECGVFGIYGPGLEVARLTYFGLYALQHRGQESAGIAVAGDSRISLHKAMGLVSEVFSSEDLEKLGGQIAIGHVRYSTTGSSHPVNAQPLVFYYSGGMVALAHNGNLTNAAKLRKILGEQGSVFQSTTDSEIIVNLMARYASGSVEAALQQCLGGVCGAYSLVVMTEKKLFGVRDPFGIRPLCLGRLGEAYILASESCALDTIGATFIRDLDPGEIVVIDDGGIRSLFLSRAPRRALCIFEFVYFARPDSRIDGETVNLARWRMGRRLASEYAVPADVVVPVPDSGTTAAMGYAEASGIPFQEGLIKNRYIGRTFIQPSQSMRDLGVRMKLNPVREILSGRRVILVDDSIVRGTTSRKIIQMLRGAGVREVHLLASSPPILYPCFYGIDTSGRGELIASGHETEEVRCFIGADGLHYLSLEGLFGSMAQPAENFCAACFNGKYPVAVPFSGEGDKLALESLKYKGGCS